MGVTTFQIIFDDSARVFSGGSTVSGRVVLVLDKPKKCEGVFVTLHGEAKVYWTETRSSTDSLGNSTTETDTYSDTEVYADTVVCVYRPTGDSCEIPLGRYEFPFSFRLPPTLPTSFESYYGKVRYCVKGKVRRPWRFDHVVREFFTVNAELNLNGSFNYALGIAAEEMKRSGCCCCPAGPVYCQIKLPKSGYVPGERIEPVITVDNTLSSDVIHNVRLMLQQKIINKAKTKSNTEKRILAECHLGRVDIGNRREYATAYLSVPAVPPTNLGGYCNIIEVHYFCKVTMEMGGFSSNVRASAYITIGTIPLVQSTALPTAPSAESPPPYPGTPPEASSLPSAPPLPHCDLPPPTYEECMFGKQDVSSEEDRYTGGDKHFAPRYPMYGFQH